MNFDSSSTVQFDDSGASYWTESDHARHIPNGGNVPYVTPVGRIFDSPAKNDNTGPITYVHSACKADESNDRIRTVEDDRSDLVCTIDPTAIRNRWLRAFIPDPDEHLKSNPPGIQAYISRMLKAYTSCMVHASSLPPFIHEQQIACPSPNSPLANCCSLLKVCESEVPRNEAMVQGLIEQEMRNIQEQRSTFSPTNLLAAFQAYLVYVMALFFNLERQQNPALRQYMITLQQLACESSTQGLMTTAELSHARPRWASWILAEAKRRTLYTMYLFDDLLCTKDGLPIFIGTELTGLPATASKHLWRATHEAEWKAAYNEHLSRWDQAGLYLDELWPITPNLSEESVTERRRRVDKWLESVDEYGTMLYAITICTDGG